MNLFLFVRLILIGIWLVGRSPKTEVSDEAYLEAGRFGTSLPGSFPVRVRGVVVVLADRPGLGHLQTPDDGTGSDPVLPLGLRECGNISD